MGLVREPPLREHRNPVTEVERALQIVRGEDNGSRWNLAAGYKRSKQIEVLLIQARVRFVEQKHGGIVY